MSINREKYKKIIIHYNFGTLWYFYKLYWISSKRDIIKYKNKSRRNANHISSFSNETLFLVL